MTRFRAALAASLLLASALSASAAPALRRYALVVGANDGGPGRARLRYAVTDARGFARVLETLGGVAKEDRVLLVEPSRKRVLDEIARLRGRLEDTRASGGRSELVVYYSGHSDENGMLLGRERLPYVEFRRLMSEIPADIRIAVVDACASGALTRQKGGQHRAPFLVDASTRMTGHAYLTSSSADEAAQESDRIRASFFTHYLVSGLRGAADASRDGKVTLDEAYQYAFHETLARTEKTQGGPQHPGYEIHLSGSGDVVMTDLRGTSAALVLPAAVAGRIWVRESEGRLVAELAKPAGRPVELALEPGEYSVLLEKGGAAWSASFALSDGQRGTLPASRFVRASSERTVRRGGPIAEEALESAALDPADDIASAGSALAGAQPADASEASLAATPAGEGPVDSAAPAAAALPIALGAPAATAEARAPQPDTAQPASLVGTSTAALFGPPPKDSDIIDQPFFFSLIPDIGTGARVSRRARHNLAINLIIGEAAEIRGFEITSVLSQIHRDLTGVQAVMGLSLVGGDVAGIQGGSFNLLRGDLRGAQLGTGFNLAEGSMRGVQLATGFNKSGRDTRGLQIATGANIADGDLRFGQATSGLNLVQGDLLGFQAAAGLDWTRGTVLGLQTAGGGNVAGSLRGVQIGGGANIARHGMRWLQIAGGYNHGGGEGRGAQVAGAANYARALQGAQISVVNIAGTVQGAQIGLVNIAGKARGAQVGLVNLSRRLDGAAVGLVNFSRSWRFEGDAWADECGLAHLGVVGGGDVFYTTWTLSGKPVSSTLPVGGGIGLGLRLPSQRHLLAAEAIASHLRPLEGGHDASLFRLRLLAGRRLAPRLAAYAGLSYSVLLPSQEGESPAVSPAGEYHASFASGVAAWPGVVLGARF